MPMSWDLPACSSDSNDELECNTQKFTFWGSYIHFDFL